MPHKARCGSTRSPAARLTARRRSPAARASASPAPTNSSSRASRAVISRRSPARSSAPRRVRPLEEVKMDSRTLTVRKVARLARGMPASDGAGVKLNRVIGTPDLPDLDPFLMLDEFRSDDAADYIAGFPDHPHRGFETVTYMLAGRMRHGDNKGHTGRLDAGSVQWMTAGRGIVHSEMPEQEDGLMQGFQLWVNLPAKDKMTAPRYQDIAAERVPNVALGEGASARVLAGELAGVRGPVDPGETQPLFFDLSLAPGAEARIPTPEGHNGFVYVYEGEAEVGEPAER